MGDSKGDLSRTAMGQDAILLWGSPCLSFLAKPRRETELWTEFSIPDLISNPTYSVFAVSSAVSFCHFSLEPESQEAGVSPESPGILMEDSVGCQHTGAARGQFQLEKSVSFLSPPPMAPRRPPHTHTPYTGFPFQGSRHWRSWIWAPAEALVLQGFCDQVCTIILSLQHCKTADGGKGQAGWRNSPACSHSSDLPKNGLLGVAMLPRLCLVQPQKGQGLA